MEARVRNKFKQQGLGVIREMLSRKGTHVHLLGVCGVGVAGLALILKERGHKVSGCDVSPNLSVASLEGRGITVETGHSPSHIDSDIKWVIRSAAVPLECPELVYAAELGLPVFLRGEVLAALVSEHQSVAVGGTHGKTTTSSMIARILKEAGRKVSWCIGGESEGMGVSEYQNDGVMVVEADESDGTISLYKPDIAVITNVEFDHMEHFENVEAFEECFRTFARNARQSVIFCADDPRARKIIAESGKRKAERC